MGLALEAAIGGYCAEMKASLLHGRTFSFNVSCKSVGFHIYNLRKFECPQFKCFFHLWGRGGPNWKKEFNAWQKERAEEWILVSPSKRRVQLGHNALKSAVPRSSIKSGKAPRRKLKFSENISYVACKGYSDREVLLKEDSHHTITFGSFKYSGGQNAVVSSSAERFDPVHKHSSFEVGNSSSTENIVRPIESDPDGLLAFNQMVDDMAFQVWKCNKCLSMGHDRIECKNRVRCLACFRSGHIRKNCPGQKKEKTLRWVPKESLVNSGDPGVNSSTKSPTVSSPSPTKTPIQSSPPTPPPPPLLTTSAPLPTPPSSAAMANFS